MGNLNQKTLQTSVQDVVEEEATTSIFTCEICIEPITPPNNKFRNSNKCVHPFCTDCLIKYIQVKLEENVSDIRCPAPTCNHSLEPLSCRPKIPQQLFDRWCDVLCESTVLGVNNNNRVYCPNKECSELILNECGDGNLTRCMCPHCNKPFCYVCKVPWHAGSTCKEARANKDEIDAAFDVLYTANKWSRCPKCGQCVENVGNCSNIHCRCGFVFCYTCGNDDCIQRRIQDRRDLVIALRVAGLLAVASLILLVIVASINN